MSRDKQAEQLLAREQQVKKVQITGILESISMGQFKVDGPLTKHHKKFNFKLVTSYEQTVKFAELDALAQAFKTKEIDFVTRKGDSESGCDSCGWGADEGDLTITINNAAIE